MFQRTAIALALLFPFVSLPLRAQANSDAPFHEAGWTITVSSVSGQITVSHDRLGAIMEHITLNLSDDRGLHPLTGWSVKTGSSTRLLIRTSAPATGWQFDVEPNLLKISSTAEHAVITADLPASPGPHPRPTARPARRPGELGWDHRSTGQLWRQHHPEPFDAAVLQSRMHVFFARSGGQCRDSRSVRPQVGYGHKLPGTQPDAARSAKSGCAETRIAAAGKRRRAPDPRLLHKDAGAAIL